MKDLSCFAWFWKNAEYRQLMSSVMKKRNRDHPEILRKACEKSRTVKGNRGQKTKLLWRKDKYRQHMSKVHTGKNHPHTPEWNRKIGEKRSKWIACHKEEYDKYLSELRSRITPESIEKMRQSQLDKWEREGGIRRSQLEINVFNAIKEHVPNIEHSVRMFNSFFVDILHRSTRTIICVNGTYWHSRPKQRQLDGLLKRLARENNYKVIELKEEDLKVNFNGVINGVINKLV